MKNKNKGLAFLVLMLVTFTAHVESSTAGTDVQQSQVLLAHIDKTESSLRQAKSELAIHLVFFGTLVLALTVFKEEGDYYKKLRSTTK